MIGLIWALLRQVEVFSLFVVELGKLHANLIEMERCHLFIEVLRQRIDLAVILALLRPEFDLRERLVGEGR